MRPFILPLAALLLLPTACKEAEAPVAEAKVSPVEANRLALADERRVLPLEGGVNFRDLGGYMTTDGRVTKWETVYRSGSPAGLTVKDQAELARRGIRTVCDLRANEEREAEPNPYVATNDDITYWTRDYTQSMGDLGKVLTGPDAGPEASRAALIAAYRLMPQEQAEGFRQMFAFLARGQVPLVFNCTAGKDRTGIAAALLLTLVGVPRETVVADYALTDDIVDFKKQMQESVATNPSYAFLLDLPWETVEPLVASDPAYIEAALAAIEEKYGSVDKYIERELGVTAEMKQTIVAALTQEA